MPKIIWASWPTGKQKGVKQKGVTCAYWKQKGDEVESASSAFECAFFSASRRLRGESAFPAPIKGRRKGDK
jgi:hypothetical protein